uniref:CID domain-containing protein n=1 Tax=Ananas comosus var. bracteatus TaxID=296719 RepID=A0A6V7NFT9_ANACO|nr:unnamed protein product [Ananas comosus var. bracteatus]
MQCRLFSLKPSPMSLKDSEICIAMTSTKAEMNSAFSDQVLAEKLSKLNSSQQSIESLSHWCISHRKKAKPVVETWEKQFNSSSKEQKVSFLYLANDILQNSKRKGSEFVNEFWKSFFQLLVEVMNVTVPPYTTIEIWEERRVFGSRGQGLKDAVLGDAPPALDNNGKSSNPIKIVRKDANTIRIKLAVGGMPEKIVTAYQSVLDEHFNEDTALNKCKDSIQLLGKMEKDVNDACFQGNQQGSPLIADLQDQETILKQCIQQLETVEATRATLVDQLKEALKEQESKLELVRTQLQAARAETDHTSKMRQRLDPSQPSNGLNPSPGILSRPSETALIREQNLPFLTPVAPQPQPPPQPITSFASTLTSAEEEHKKAAAAVAARLAASSSSAQVLSSILSSLAAEEAASMNSFSASPPLFQAEKKPRLEKPISVSDMSTGPYFGPQPPAQTNQASSSAFPPLPPPPLPPLPPLSMQQFAKTGGLMAGLLPQGFLGNSLPPPPPLPSHVGLARPSGPPPPPPLPPPPQQQQQLQSASTGFYPPPGLGFYGQVQPTPPAQRQ